MKVLKAGIDFKRSININPNIGDTLLVKQSIATGWAKEVKVIRLTKTQIEVEITNLVPTEETNNFGVKNGLLDRHDNFFADWAFRKNILIGKRFKFFKDTTIQVGSTNNWNANILVELIN